MTFKVGETVVYPHHGAAFIEEMKTRTIKGEEKVYLKLKVAQGDLTIEVPAENCDLVGVRDVVGKEGLDKVFEVLRAEHTEEPTNWSRRYKANLEKLASGDVIRVAEENGGVVGWARLYPWSDRCAYARSAENSVYVRKDARGRGVGSELLEALIKRAREAGVCVLLARIAEGNPASIRLHEAAGFEAIGVMRRVGEKFGRILDVHLMQMHLDK